MKSTTGASKPVARDLRSEFPFATRVCFVATQNPLLEMVSFQGVLRKWKVRWALGVIQ